MGLAVLLYVSATWLVVSSPNQDFFVPELAISLLPFTMIY